MKKLYAYIDGYNFYWGMMDHGNNMPGASYPPPVFRKYLWLNLNTLISSYFSSDDYYLSKIHYFTAPVRDAPDAIERQEVYWKALESIPHLSICKGSFARRYDEDGNISRYEEKQSDVNFALQAFDDALHVPDLSAMVFLCADSDQVPTVNRIQGLDKEIELFYPFLTKFHRFSQVQQVWIVPLQLP